MAGRQAVLRARRSLDDRVSGMHPIAPAPRSGWIRAVRTALGMTQGELATRMGVTTQSASRLESNERSGAIRLDSLRRAADALGCDVAYVLVPRVGSFERAVLDQAARVVDDRLHQVDRTMRLENQQADLTGRDRDDLIRQVAAEAAIWKHE